MEKILPRDLNRRIGRAMHTYDMLADGDRVLVAVSGGIDSLFLAWLLDFWRRKAPISYDLAAVHIDMEPNRDGPGSSALEVQHQLSQFHLPVAVVPAEWRPESSAMESNVHQKDVCFTCARHRRRQLFDFARRSNWNKIALGHHKDDIVETFFLNICFAGNISTMVPKQELFSGRLALIRPLSFVEKSEIRLLAEKIGITPVRTTCPLGEQTRRLEIRQVLDKLYEQIPDAKKRIFAALANVRHDYLLKAAGEGSGGTEL